MPFICHQNQLSSLPRSLETSLIGLIGQLTQLWRQVISNWTKLNRCRPIRFISDQNQRSSSFRSLDTMLIGLIAQLAQLVLSYPFRFIWILFRLPRPFLWAQDCLSTPKTCGVMKLWSLNVLISSYLADNLADKDRIAYRRVSCHPHLFEVPVYEISKV